MIDVLLLVSFLAAAAFGFFLTAKLDQFLEENRKAIAEEKKKRKPYVIISNAATKEDMLGEIEKFRRDHSCAYVVVCDPTQADYIDFYDTQPAETTEKEVCINGKTSKR